MHIESGTTAWWRNRHLMFLALFLGSALWFGYDGYIRYPAQNKRTFAGAMGVSLDSFEFNQRVTRSVLSDIVRENQGKGIALDVLTERFGEPTLFKENKENKENKEIWYVGLDVYMKVTLSAAGNNAEVQPSGDPVTKVHTASDMQLQRILSVALLVGSVLIAMKTIRVMTTKVVLDDSGLRYNRKQIPWEKMTGLRGDTYARKGWVHLDTSGGAFKLDSYHVARFDEIVSAICERKGFPSPLTAAAGEPEAGGSEAQP